MFKVKSKETGEIYTVYDIAVGIISPLFLVWKRDIKAWRWVSMHDYELVKE